MRTTVSGLLSRVPSRSSCAIRRDLSFVGVRSSAPVCALPRACARPLPLHLPLGLFSLPGSLETFSRLHFTLCCKKKVTDRSTYPSTTSKFGVYRQNGDIEFSSIDLPYISPRIHRIFSCTFSRTYSRPSAHLGSRNYSQPDQWTRRFYRRLDQWTPRLYHRLARLLSTTLYNSSVARLLSGSCFKPFLLDIAGGRAGVRALLSRNEKTYISPEESLAPAI
jgi:hypothetical protein